MEKKQSWKCKACFEKKADNNVTVRKKPFQLANESQAVHKVIQPSTSVQTQNITTEYNENDLQLRMRAFKEEFFSEFFNMQSSLTTELKRVSEEIKGLCSDMRDVRVEIAEFRSTLKENQDRMTSIENRLTAIENSEGSDSSSSSFTKLEDKIRDLKTELQNRDQISLLNDLEIAGIPEAQGENPIHIVSLLATQMGLSLDERDIVFAERTGAPTSLLASTNPESAPATASTAAAAAAKPPRRIVIRFTRRTTRDNYLQAARVRRGITSNNVLPTGPTNRVYVNERLTKINRQLFAKGREACRRKQWKYCWTRDGQIFVRKEHGAPYFRITSNEDFDRVFGVNTV